MRFMLDSTMFAVPLLASVLIGPMGVAVVMLIYSTIHFFAPWMIRIPKRLDKLDNCMNVSMWGDIRPEAIPPTKQDQNITARKSYADVLEQDDVIGQDDVLIESVNPFK